MTGVTFLPGGMQNRKGSLVKPARSFSVRDQTNIVEVPSHYGARRDTVPDPTGRFQLD